MKTFKNILIVRTDRIGDVVLTTPSIKALRQAYPDTEISILVRPYTKPLVDGNPYLDNVFIDDRLSVHKGLLGFLRLVRMLQKNKFDCAIIYHTKRRTNLACFLAGIHYRIGYKNEKYGFFLTDPIKDTRHLGQRHEAQYCLDLLQHLGINSDDLELLVPMQKDAEQWVNQLFANRQLSSEEKLIVIHPGASDPSKRWPEHRFKELIKKLREHYSCKVVMIGANETKQITHNILESNFRNIIDLTGQISLSQLISLLKKTDVLISNDSGPVHISAGVGTPVVSIFTRNQRGINPERWRPLGNTAKVVSVPFNEKISFSKAQPIDPQYMELIKTQEVVEAVDSIFKLC